MDMLYFARICAHAQSWREFAKFCFAHFPSFFSVHVDTYGIVRVRDPEPNYSWKLNWGVTSSEALSPVSDTSRVLLERNHGRN